MPWGVTKIHPCVSWTKGVGTYLFVIKILSGDPLYGNAGLAWRTYMLKKE